MEENIFKNFEILMSSYEQVIVSQSRLKQRYSWYNRYNRLWMNKLWHKTCLFWHTDPLWHTSKRKIVWRWDLFFDLVTNVWRKMWRKESQFGGAKRHLVESSFWFSILFIRHKSSEKVMTLWQSQFSIHSVCENTIIQLDMFSVIYWYPLNFFWSAIEA